MKQRIEQALHSFGTAPAILAASVFLTLMFWIALPESMEVNESSDYIDFYEPVARNILGGRGITFEDKIAVRTPPGYPVYLAGVFGLAGGLEVAEETVLSVLILLCTGLSSLFLFILSRQVWGALPAVVSTLVWATYPLALWLTKQPNSEIPFLVFFYGGFTLLWTTLLRDQGVGKFYFLSGFLIGLAMLIRPIAIGTGLVMALIVWFVKQDVRWRVRAAFVGLVLCGNIIAVLPWQVWLYTKTERIVLLSSAGTSNIVKGLTFALHKSRLEPSGAPDDVVKLMEDIAANRNDMRSLPDVLGVMSHELRDRPLATMKLLSMKLMRSWYGTDTQRFEYAILLLQLPYVALVLWGTYRSWVMGGLARQLAISVWMVALYFWGMTFMAVSLARYTVPAAGLLFVVIPAILPLSTVCKPIQVRRDG